MISYFIRTHPHVFLLNLGALLIAVGIHIAGAGLQVYPIVMGISLVISAICLQAQKDFY